MTNTGSKTGRKHITICTLDLTLDQLDEAAALVDAGECGRMAATAFVALKGTGTPLTLDEVRVLTFRDVTIREDDDGDGDDPTHAR